jgi:phosphoenolpyruvate carboxykinase (ATP)
MNNMKSFANRVFSNLSCPQLIEHALRANEGVLSKAGALITNTGKYTGRSPKDKFTVVDEVTKHLVWFSDINNKILPHQAQNLLQKIQKYLKERAHYVTDCVAGANNRHSLKIRVITERAWHALFAQNMFIPLSNEEINKQPDFHIFHAPGFLADPKVDGTNSEAAVILDFKNKNIIICGSEYAGEIKKSVFTALNFLLPNKGILSMHCSANKNANQEVAIFFGLSGTGKTTLSADSSRYLIGDDEHGWDDDGVFNFEGGCYAKVIKLSAADEPEIYHASKHFGSILENVVYNENSREIDFDDDKYTQNTRSSYDISLIPNACKSGLGGHPKHIFMLVCDAFGVLPPIAKLSPEAAAYHFINGYTAKVAGTERGVVEPQAVFSTCFGAPFMAHFPKVYAQIFQEKIKAHKAHCWLINTGWTGGPYSVGSRIKINITRNLLHAALSGELENGQFINDPIFNIMIPKKVQGVPSNTIIPRDSWQDKAAYDRQAKKLAGLFHENCRPYSSMLPKEVLASGPIHEI